MDSLSTIITFGALLGKVSPVQLMTLGLFQSLLYHTNRFAIDLTLGAVDDMGGATVTHVFGAVYGTATSIMIYKTHPGFDHPEHNSRYVSGLYVILNVYNVLKTPLFFILIVLAGMPFGAPCGYGLLSLPTMDSSHRTFCVSVWF
jgi:ammonium transporter Rh